MARSTIAVTDLCQIGQQARFRRFEFQYHSDPQKLQQIKSEKDKLMRLEKKKAKERLPLPSYERWRLELLEAFNFIAGSLTPPVIEDRQDVRDGKLGNPQLVLGRIGFRKLVAFGKIFGAKEDVQALDEYFKTMDPLWSACLNHYLSKLSEFLSYILQPLFNSVRANLGLVPETSRNSRQISIQAEEETFLLLGQ